MRSMPAPVKSDTAVRRRTRRAIIDAAVVLWARDFAAPLGEVASQAGVSRSTLHRYFADREALIDGCLETAHEVFGEADSCAPSVADLRPIEQLARHMQSAVALGNWVLFLWTDPTRFDGRPGSQAAFGQVGEDPALQLLRAAQEAGDVDQTAPAEWLLSVYYSLLYAAAEAAASGTIAPYDAGRLAVRALRHGIDA